MSEAEEKKLEAADKARKDGEGKDLGEDPTENTQGQKRDAARKDEGQGEEIPAWADAIMKRMDAMERDRKDSEARKDEERRPLEADKARKDESEEEKERKEREDKARKDESEEERRKHEAEGGHKANEERDRKEREEREDRARKDAAVAATTRTQAAKIAELEARLNAVYVEPSIDDRNQIAETRNRADGLYQALTGQPASQAQPGESPIAYRKRMADGLRKYSERMKDVRLDSLAGEAFAVIEDHIYTDAHAAIRSDAIVPAGQLRAIKTMDRGRERTEYVGDSSVTWAPFMAGAYRVGKLTRPVH
ncbi:MAG: hypothetical protein B7X10_01045 [Burkholderiales bacterium 21-58-4]|nr:MAG: hypothetical protein B7X10_01045 [Burkholderiales bacterium 21-58-4]